MGKDIPMWLKASLKKTKNKKQPNKLYIKEKKMHNCHPSPRKAEAGRLRISGQPGLHGETLCQTLGVVLHLSFHFFLP